MDFAERFHCDAAGDRTAPRMADGKFGGEVDRASAMAGKKKRTAEPDEEKATQEARDQGEEQHSRSNAELVGKVIANIEAKLAKDQLKPTVGDLIRLLQIKKELTEEQPREITVSWIEPDEKEDASAE
jgi:hypothetical protein